MKIDPIEDEEKKEGALAENAGTSEETTTGGDETLPQDGDEEVKS